MEKHPGTEAQHNTVETYNLSAEAFEAALQQVAPEKSISRAYLISLLVPNYASLSSIEIGRINAEIEPYIQEAISKGFLKSDAVNPAFSFTRTEKEKTAEILPFERKKAA